MPLGMLVFEAVHKLGVWPVGDSLLSSNDSTHANHVMERRLDIYLHV
jgi:hypothetical protein